MVLQWCTYITILLKNNFNIKEIANLLGHFEEDCKICTYDYMIEIKGIVYELEDSTEVIEWFDNFYESNKNDFNEKIL